MSILNKIAVGAAAAYAVYKAGSRSKAAAPERAGAAKTKPARKGAKASAKAPMKRRRPAKKRPAKAATTS